MKTILKKYVVKTWGELTEEEKEKEKENYCVEISNTWYDLCYEDFKYGLEEIKGKYKNIKFENVHIDDNSQGWWVDEVKGFKYCIDSISIYDENISVDDIDLTIRKTIEKINANDVIIDVYYIDSNKLEKIKNTKKYKKWIEKIVQNVNNWVEEINSLLEDYMKDIDCIPDEFVEDYFINNDVEFEFYVDTIDNTQLNDTLYYLATHNKNYNNEQYEKIIELKEMFEKKGELIKND